MIQLALGRGEHFRHLRLTTKQTLPLGANTTASCS